MNKRKVKVSILYKYVGYTRARLDLHTYVYAPYKKHAWFEDTDTTKKPPIQRLW